VQSTKAFASTRVSAPPPADAAARAALERPRPRALGHLARYLETHCKLTDQVEREIERRVGRYPATGGLFGEGGSACR